MNQIDPEHHPRTSRHGCLLVVGIFILLALAAGAIILVGGGQRGSTGDPKVDRLIAQAHQAADPGLLYQFQTWLAMQGLWDEPPYIDTWEIQNAIGELDPSAIPALAKAMTFSSDPVRVMIVQSMDDIEGPDALKLLIGALADRAAEVRAAAASELRWFEGNETAVPDLLKTLADADPSVRAAAAGALESISDNRILPALIAALKDSDAIVRAAVVDALGSSNDPSVVPHLLGMLSDPQVDVVESAVEALGNLGDYRATAPLLSMLKSGAIFSQTIIEALGELGDPAAVPDLITMLDSGPDQTRTSAIDALGEIGDRRATMPIIRAMAKLTDQDIEKAIEALGELGDPAALPAIQAIVQKLLPKPGATPVSTEERDEEVLNAAIQALGQIGGTQTTPAIIALLEHKTYASAVLSMIEDLGDSQAYEAVAKLLDSPDESTRAKAAQVLGYLGRTEAVAALIGLLDDADDDVRENAAAALGRLGDRSAVQPLIAKLHDNESNVGFWAAQSLAMLGDKSACDAIVPLVNDKQETVQIIAAYSLACLGDGRGVGVLEENLKDTGWSFLAAAASLCRLGTEDARALLIAARARATRPEQQAMLDAAINHDSRGYFEFLLGRTRDDDLSNAIRAAEHENDSALLPLLDQIAQTHGSATTRISARQAAQRLRWMGE